MSLREFWVLADNCSAAAAQRSLAAEPKLFGKVSQQNLGPGGRAAGDQEPQSIERQVAQVLLEQAGYANSPDEGLVEAVEHELKQSTPRQPRLPTA